MPRSGSSRADGSAYAEIPLPKKLSQHGAYISLMELLALYLW
jgi:hypothetical protein